MAALGDFLAGVGGAPVNRPGLEAFVANSQSSNMLRSAQTEEALLNAQNLRDEQDAKTRMESNLADALTAVGDPHPREHAAVVNSAMASHYGNFKDSEAGFGEMLKNTNTQHIMDPTADPNQRLASDQANSPGANPVQNVGDQLIPRFAPNSQGGQAVVQQTPVSQADIQAKQAAAKKAAQAGGPQDPDAIAYGSYMLYKTGKMPALGMGAGPARAAILSGAAQLSQREAQGEDVGNPGYDTAIANGQDYTAGGRALGSFAGGPLGNQTRALNNVVGHLRLFEDSFNALNNGDMQALNKLSNAWNKQFGVAAPTNMHAMATIVGPELTKILAGTNAGTGEERQQFSEGAGALENSPDQMGTAITTLRGMLGRQAADLALQYHGATGRSDFARRYLQPDVANDLQLNSDTAQQPTGTTPAGPKTSTTPAGPKTPAGANAGGLPTLSDIEAELARRRGGK